jgi:hypothetical protein
MMHRIERGLFFFGLDRIAEPQLDGRPPEDHSSATLVIVYPFLELSRAYQIPDGLFAIGDEKSELLDGKVFTERPRIMMRLASRFGLQFRDRFRELVDRALQSFEYRRIHTNP